ncbi:MAG: gamma-glutamyltransferase [Actinobacteria bacterium]|nr:gamma-glutamyltransferase [Actinomycetota bacterium]
MDRTRYTATSLALSTPQAAATAAGQAAFERGGNAFDACLAAALSLTVIYPDNCALGGDLIALVHRADGNRTIINSSGPAASGVDVDALREAGARMPTTGPAPITVPGLIGGLGRLWSEGAALGWEEAFRAAIEQARDGVTVVPSLATSIAIEAEALGRDPGCRETFYIEGRPLRAGDVLRQSALAKTLETLAAEGPEAFYRGPIGRTLAAGLRSQGSHLTAADLAGFVPESTTPLVARLDGDQVATAPANSQGILLPPLLAVVDRLGAGFDPLGPRAGELALAFRAATSLRDEYLCDPVATGSSPTPIPADVDLLSRAGAAPAPPRANGDTVVIVAADDAGNTVSLLQSLFHRFGAVILEPETGILLHNRGSFFSLDHGSSNVIAGGKRPAHTLTPCTVFHRGRPRAVIATMGGAAQPQILVQILLRLRLGDTPAAAVGAPRWVVGGLDEGDAPDQILVDEGVPEAAVRSLAETGMPIRHLPRLDSSVGHAQLIVRADDGSFTAASDPRSEGAAVVLGS